MKKRYIIIINILMVGLILFIIVKYANDRAAEAGTPMTVDEAISYIRKAKISPEISGHLIYIDDGSMTGISTTARSTDSSNFSVKYSHINIFENLEISNVNGVVNLMSLSKVFSRRGRNTRFHLWRLM